MPDMSLPGSACQSPVIPAHPLIGREENMKMMFDMYLALNHQSAVDNQINARRRASNDSSFDHLVSMAVGAALVTATQTGDTENDQTVSPVRTGTGDAIVGSEGISADTVATANATVAASLGNLASALVPIIAGTSGVVTVQTLAAVLATVVASAGTASQAAATPGATK